MVETCPTGLFGDITITPTERRESRIAERKRKAKLAFEKTSEAWKAATYEFAVNVFLPANERFLFQELSHGYEEYAKANGRPATVEKRAFAGLQSRLIKAGLIIRTNEVGYRSNGQIGNFYVRAK